MDFEHLLGLHTGTRTDPLPIFEIERGIAQAIGATTSRVLLSAATIRKQIAHHRELPISAYRYLQPCLRRGEYRQDSARSVLILFTDTDADAARTHVRACLKATANGEEIYLVSFLRMRERDLRREQRKAHPILRSAR